MGTATVPAIVNANGTWTIDNNGTATTHVFDLDSTLFNSVDGTGHQMLALKFDEDTDEAAFRFRAPPCAADTLAVGVTFRPVRVCPCLCFSI